MNTRPLLSACLLGLLLTACGGGGDSPPPVAVDPVEVPANADDTSAGYTTYTSTQVARTAETTTEPLGLEQVMVSAMMSSENDDPVAFE